MRSLQVTDSIKRKMIANMGEDLPDLETIRVYEATAVSTRPVNKAGTIWDKARLSRQTLAEMATLVQGGEYIPMHTMHNQGWELPVGRLFWAEMMDLGDDDAELRVLFYLDAEDERVSSIEKGILKNLSVGVMTKRMLCSECGWDYLGDEATFRNLFDRVCGNDHALGENGIHIKAAGLDRWFELSLVSVGASKDAEIKSRSSSKLSEDHLRQLAASGLPVESVLFVASNQGETMDLKELTAELKASVSEAAQASVALKASEAKVETLETELSTANQTVAELTAKLEAAGADDQVVTVTAELTTTKEALSASETANAASLAFLQEQAVLAMTAAGKENPTAPETIEACIASFADAKQILHTIPVGGVSSATTGDEAPAQVANFDAFKSRSN